MLHKFNVTTLNEYSERFAQKVCDDFFVHNTAASGQHILNLTKIPQINLFVISSLYDKWKVDAEAFRSPYFDFTHVEVSEALKQFMNVVSRNILVKREALEPLLANATKDSLVLLIDPSGYFNEIFRSQTDFTVTAEVIQQLRKYIRLNKFIPQAIAEAMNERSFVYVNQAIDWTEQAITNRASELENIGQWIALFSEKVPLEVGDLLKKVLRTEPTEVVKTSEIEPNKSFFDALEPEPTVVKAKEEPPKETEVKPPIPIVAPPKPSNVYETVFANSNGTKESLNDSFRSEKSSISDAFQKQAITSITQSISLNQKIMFIHGLFNGSNSAYEAAINELEQAQDFGAARSLISYKLASQYQWDMTSDTVGDLLEIVKRRFS
ncbi:MAG: hypothetical protein R2822_04180 [Spirosomataceae bacterium]